MTRSFYGRTFTQECLDKGIGCRPALSTYPEGLVKRHGRDYSVEGQGCHLHNAGSLEPMHVVQEAMLDSRRSLD